MVSGSAAQWTLTNGPRALAAVVDRLRHQLLAGAGLAQDEDAGVALGDGVDLVVDVAHLVRAPDDVRGLEAIAQLGEQPLVLLVEALALLFRQPPHLDRLRDHRRHDGEEPHVIVEIELGVELAIDRQRAEDLAPDLDRNADERDVGTLAAAGAVEEDRRLAGARNDGGLAALDHLAGDALAQLVAAGLDLLLRHTVREVDQDVAGLAVEQRHRAVPQLHVLGQGLEHRLDHLGHVRVLVEDAAQPVEELELFYLAAFADSGFHFCRGCGGFRHSCPSRTRILHDSRPRVTI